MRERLYDRPLSPSLDVGDHTKNTMVNETENEGSKPHSNTHASHQTGGS